MSAPELKPCPFCGSIAHMRREPCADGAGYFAYIQCNGCRSRSSETYYSAGNDCPQLYQGRRDAWNTRTDTILSDPRVKALVEAVEAAFACGMIPKSTASEGVANKFSEQVRVADQLRAAMKGLGK